MIQRHGKYLFVGVPEDAKNFRLNIYGTMVGYSSESHIAPFPEGDHIPKGQYSIVGLHKDLTEEQWEGIVEEFDREYKGGEKEIFYQNYVGYFEEENFQPYYVKAKLSGYSLLKHLGFKPDENVLILAQNN